MVLEEKDFIRLKEYMYSHYGIDLKGKQGLVQGRLSAVVTKMGYKSFAGYIDDLLHNENESMISVLVSRLTTNYTYFMREKEHYDFTVSTALKELLPKIHNKDLRIWSAACSSGEEPYTIAMVLDNYFKEEAKNWDKVVLASDISTNVLSKAIKGVYDQKQLTALESSYTDKYFTKIDEHSYQVTKYLRSQVAYRKINLAEPFTFKRKFHIIFCRNVMIYFDSPTKTKLLNKFYDELVPGGYLYVGLSETIKNLDTKFKYVKPAIYIK